MRGSRKKIRKTAMLTMNSITIAPTRRRIRYANTGTAGGGPTAVARTTAAGRPAPSPTFRLLLHAEREVVVHAVRVVDEDVGQVRRTVQQRLAPGAGQDVGVLHD